MELPTFLLVLVCIAFVLAILGDASFVWGFFRTMETKKSGRFIAAATALWSSVFVCVAIGSFVIGMLLFGAVLSAIAAAFAFITYKVLTDPRMKCVDIDCE